MLEAFYWHEIEDWYRAIVIGAANG